MNNNFNKKSSDVTWYILNIAIYLFYYILIHNLFYALLFTIPNMLFTILLIDNIEKCINKNDKYIHKKTFKIFSKKSKESKKRQKV